jgi:hypothetical protein
MGAFLKFLAKVLVGAAIVIAFLLGALRMNTLEGQVAAARKAADEARAAVAATEKRAQADLAAALAKAKAEAEVLPKPLPVKLDTDPATLALFPDGAFLMEPDADGEPENCKDIKRFYHWVRLVPDGKRRSVMERSEASGSKILIGILSLGLSAFAGPTPPVRTIFSAHTDGAYTTLMLGAARGPDEPDLVGPQVRLTLYRIAGGRFGVVERVPIDEPALARPAKGQPKIVQPLRLCVYRSGSGVGEL